MVLKRDFIFGILFLYSKHEKSIVLKTLQPIIEHFGSKFKLKKFEKKVRIVKRYCNLSKWKHFFKKAIAKSIAALF